MLEKDRKKEKEKKSEMEKQKSERQYSWQQTKHAELYSNLLQAFKEEAFGRSVFTAEGTLFFASAVPYCRFGIMNVVFGSRVMQHS